MASSKHSEQAASGPFNDYLGTITVDRETDTITVLGLQGEFDMSLSPQIGEYAQRVIESKQHLIIDLSDTTFIDSSVIHALFRARTAAQDHGRRFALQFGSSKGVERVLTITGADKALPIAATRAEAVELIERGLGSDSTSLGPGPAVAASTSP